MQHAGFLPDEPDSSACRPSELQNDIGWNGQRQCIVQKQERDRTHTKSNLSSVNGYFYLDCYRQMRGKQ